VKISIHFSKYTDYTAIGKLRKTRRNKICFNSPKEADVKLSIYGIEPSSGTLSNKLGYTNKIVGRCNKAKQK
jgi:hypothetical protein